MLFRFIAAIRSMLGKVDAGSPTEAVKAVLKPLTDEMEDFIKKTPPGNERADMSQRLDGIEDLFEEAWFDDMAMKITRNIVGHQSQFEFDDVVGEIASHVFIQGTRAWTTRSQGGEPFTIHNIDRRGVESFFKTIADHRVRSVVHGVKDRGHVPIQEEISDEETGRPVRMQVRQKEIQSPKEFDIETKELWNQLKRYIASHAKKGKHSFEYLMFLTWMKFRDQGKRNISVTDILTDPRLRKLGLTENIAEETYTNMRKLLCDYFDKVLHHPISEQQQREWGLKCGSEVTKTILRRFLIHKRIAALILSDSGYRTPEEIVEDIRKEKAKQED
jgi:hypothetical protein